VEASGVAQLSGGPEDRRLRLVLLGPLSDQRLFCEWELVSRATAAVLLLKTVRCKKCFRKTTDSMFTAARKW
jgi:hypothetical protein